MLTDTFAGRLLLWRAPTDADHLRFPSAAVRHGDMVPQLPTAARPVEPQALQLGAVGGRPAGNLGQLLESTGTTAFLLLRDGAVICEWFAPGRDRRAPARNLSVTKSVAALLVAQAIARGQLPGMGATLGELVPQLADSRVAALRLDQLMRMASGIGYREGAVPWSDDAKVYHGTQLRRAALQRRLADPVDAFFHYNDWHPLLIALALERAVGCSVAELLGRELWTPLAGGPATMTLDRAGPDGLAHLESGFNCTAQGLARFGQLVLQRGVWEGRQLVPPGCFERLDDLSDAWREPRHFGYYAKLPWGRPLSSGKYAYKDFWWHHVPRSGVHDRFAMGALGAHVYVSPDTRCVLVRQASRFPPGLWWAGVLRQLAERVAAQG